MMHFMLRGVFAVCYVVGMTKANGCPATFTLNESPSYCHKVVRLVASRTDAAAACTSMGSHLVSIETQEEDAYLAQLTACGNFWTSGNDIVTEGTFLWSDGNPLSYTNWYLNNPYDQPDAEDCICVTSNAGGKWAWHDNDCSAERNYICEVDMPGCPATFTLNESPRYCHKVVRLVASRTDAAAACTSMGSHLASIETQEEDTYLGQLTACGNFWTSGNDIVTEGTFLWSDGNPLSYTNWYLNNPYDQPDAEDCICVTSNAGGKWAWHDNDCSAERNYICEVDMPECPIGFTFKSTAPKYCHKVGNTNVSQTDAATECATLGAQLVSIETAEEDTYLASLTVLAPGLFWTSGNDKVTEGTFVWGDGSPLSYTNWYLNNPYDQPDAEDCITTSFTGGKWAWHDNDCSMLKTSICEIKV